MNVFLASEFRGTIYNGELYLASKAYTIYERYANAFGQIVLCSRFSHVKQLPVGYQHATFIKSTIDISSLNRAFIGYYNKIMLEHMRDCSLVIVRLPSIIGYRAADCARLLGKKILTESMGDAWDAYWNHGLIGKAVAGYMWWKMRRLVLTADYAVYVTENYLQKKYPCKNNSIHASNVVIPFLSEEILTQRLQKIRNKCNSGYALMTTGNVNVTAKGHQYVIEAMAELKKKGIELTYYLAGGGDQHRLRRLAQKKGVKNAVFFLGELSMAEVYNYLDKIDIYIQPSLQEGLPRAVIEAMSRACPCLGSNTAGTPELLNSECIFKRASTKAVVDKIESFIKWDASLFAIENFERCKSYLEETLNKRRNDYFAVIRKNLTK